MWYGSGYFQVARREGGLTLNEFMFKRMKYLAEGDTPLGVSGVRWKAMLRWYDRRLELKEPIFFPNEWGED